MRPCSTMHAQGARPQVGACAECCRPCRAMGVACRQHLNHRHHRQRETQVNRWKDRCVPGRGDTPTVPRCCSRWDRARRPHSTASGTAAESRGRRCPLRPQPGPPRGAAAWGRSQGRRVECPDLWNGRGRGTGLRAPHARAKLGARRARHMAHADGVGQGSTPGARRAGPSDPCLVR